MITSSVAGMLIALTAPFDISASAVMAGPVLLPQYTMTEQLDWQIITSLSMLAMSAHQTVHSIVIMVSPSVVHAPDVADRSSLSRK